MKRTLLMLLLIVPVLAKAQTASFTVSADTVCQDSCITLINTSTGPRDSLKWFVLGDASGDPLEDTVTVCFHSSGSDTVKLFVFHSGTIDTAIRVVFINPIPSPITGFPVFCNNHPPFSTTLHDVTHGGTWSSSDTAIEVVDSNGVVTSKPIISWIDSAFIFYTLPTGCSVSLRVFDESCEGVPIVSNGNDKITLYPNPTATQLNIESSAIITTITIANLIGQMVYINHFHDEEQVQIDVASLPAGIYLLRVNGTEVRKFVKQ